MTRSIADVDELGGAGSVLTRRRRDRVRLDRLLQELDGATGAREEAILQRLNRLVLTSWTPVSGGRRRHWPR